jgi:hypothetical protein
MLTTDADMLAGMRTTIRIDDGLYRRAKEQAARSGRTVSDVIEDAVRTSLTAKPRGQRGKHRIELPVSGQGGLMPGVDISDSRALRDLMDEGTPLDALR